MFAPPNYPAPMHDPGLVASMSRVVAPLQRQAPPPPVPLASVSSTAVMGPSRRTTDPYVTGTSVLAIKFADGVMLAADTLGSYGSLARFRDIRRLLPMGKNTVLGGSGEVSDLQWIQEHMDAELTKEYVADDGIRLNAKEIHSYLTRVLYARRNKMDPLWNQLVIAGVGSDGKPFLGMADLHGTSFEDDTIATGYGAYIARPLLRKAADSGSLSAEDAKKVLEDCMRVMFYRDARTINKIQLATVKADGVTITEPYSLETQWLHGEAQVGH